MPVDSVLGEALFPGCRQLPSASSHGGEGTSSGFSASSYKDTESIMGAPTHILTGD